MKPKVIAIVGPTASGKTELALDLATKFNGEIISADSRAVYCGLDIGTAKPTPAEQKLVKHHLIDIANIGKRFTVVQFQKLAQQAINDIDSRGKVPFLVGGTGLYVDAVLYGYQFPPAGDPELRHNLELESDERLLDLLKSIDPETYEQIDRANRRRVLRAVEVALSTGQSMARLRRHRKPSYDVLILGITRSKEELHRRFDRRFAEWIKQGLIDEVRRAVDSSSLAWVQSLGLQYRYFTQYVQGDLSLEEATRLTKRSNYSFIKRQFTWFKRNREIHWIGSRDQAEATVSRFLQNLSR